MRRLVALTVVALLGAAIFGLSGASSGLAVNGVKVSGDTFRAELAAITATPALQCYLTALDQVDFAPGGGSNTMAASGAAAWADLRIEGISITQYAKIHLHFRPDAAELTSAKASLLSELTKAAAAKEYTCPGTSAQALAAMPEEMQRAEIVAQASSLDLVSKLDATLPLTPASMRAYYDSHRSDYDTLCVSIAVVPLDKQSSFAAAQADGASVAQLAGEFSSDPSAAKGGAYGCYSPSSSAYASVRQDVGTSPLDTFPTTPSQVTESGTTYDLYVAATKRTVTSFAVAENVVLSDMQDANASTANTEEETILYQAAVAVDPAFGRWGLDENGPAVFVPALPGTADVNHAATLTTRASAYQ